MALLLLPLDRPLPVSPWMLLLLPLDDWPLPFPASWMRMLPFEWPISWLDKPLSLRWPLALSPHDRFVLPVACAHAALSELCEKGDR